VIGRMPMTNAHRTPLKHALNHYASVIYFSNDYNNRNRNDALKNFVDVVKRAMDIDCDWRTKKACKEKKEALRVAAVNLLGMNMDAADKGALHTLHVHLEKLSRQKKAKGVKR